MAMMRGRRLWIALALIAASCGSQTSISDFVPTAAEGAPPIPVIVDYSPTVSDVGALMFLLSHPRIDVLAISLSETGEAGCQLGTAVSLGILAVYDREEIPIACDPEMPPHAREWPAEFIAGHDALRDGLPSRAVGADDELPGDLMARVAADSLQPVVLVAVGPLTVVAKALTEHPSMASHLERVVIMGGAIDVAGNVFDSDAEWNLYIDTVAAATVIGANVPITLVPLDATNAVPVPSDYSSMIAARQPTPAIQYLGGLVDAFPAVTSGFYYLWDELAASVAAGEGFATFEQIPVSVVVGGAQDGRTIRSDGEPITVATGVSEPRLFYEHFLDTLSSS